jgi:pyruvate dehydrogenase E2 component (dihydrolipoamide acetyltransferase)
MPAEVIMPALGMAQETGKVLRWLKAEGETVVKGEPLLEIETDKVTVELESPADGTLAGVRAAEGDEVPVGRAIAFVLAAGESTPEDAAPAPETAATAPASGNGEVAPVTIGDARPRRALASPKARRIAAERGIDLDALDGSGPSGSIVAADVARGTAAPAISSLWKTMAERTTASWQATPHFYLRRAVDASGLQAWRNDHAGVSHTDQLVKLVAEALRRHPRVNSTWRDGAIVQCDGINVAIAVATEDGLIVPVVHGADRLALDQIAARRKELVAAAREGRLRPEDVTGGSFTISNLGMYGVDSFDAIVNAPQAAILAVGRIVERIVAVDGRPAVRPVLELSVSFDHRVVDGARGAEFLDTLAGLIEEPQPIAT